MIKDYTYVVDAREKDVIGALIQFADEYGYGDYREIVSDVFYIGYGTQVDLLSATIAEAQEVKDFLEDVFRQEIMDFQ